MAHPRGLAFLAGAVLLILPVAAGQAQKASTPADEKRPGAAAQPGPSPSGPAAAPFDPPPEEPSAGRPDPPARVGRLARLEGGVHLRLPDAREWSPAGLNLPVIGGYALWVEPAGRAMLELDNHALALDGATLLEIHRFDETGLEAGLAQGRLLLRLAEPLPGETLRLALPRAGLTLAAPGLYLLEAGEEGQPSRVAVLEGSAAVLPEGQEPELLGPGDALALSADDPPRPERGPAGPPPPLLAWAEALLPKQPLPPAVLGMTGAAELGRHGQWTSTPEYGEVWLPEVPAGWVPYRQGRWVWVEPWGWNWVDEAPWGFVTSHYGRWVEWGNRWAWAPVPLLLWPRAHPGAYPRPAYAPALVRFFAGRRPGQIGWAPLGPREAWHPSYHASLAHWRRVNGPNLPEAMGRFRGGGAPPPPGSLRGATLVPQAALLRGAAPGAVALRPPGGLAGLRPLPHLPPAPRPTAMGRPALARGPLPPGLAPPSMPHPPGLPPRFAAPSRPSGFPPGGAPRDPARPGIVPPREGPPRVGAPPGAAGRPYPGKETPPLAGEPGRAPAMPRPGLGWSPPPGGRSPDGAGHAVPGGRSPGSASPRLAPPEPGPGFASPRQGAAREFPVPRPSRAPDPGPGFVPHRQGHSRDLSAPRPVPPELGPGFMPHRQGPSRDFPAPRSSPPSDPGFVPPRRGPSQDFSVPRPSRPPDPGPGSMPHRQGPSRDFSAPRPAPAFNPPQRASPPPAPSRPSGPPSGGGGGHGRERHRG